MGTDRIRKVEVEPLTFAPRCRKKRLPSREAALASQAFLYRKSRRTGRKGGPLNVYFCTTCNAWHVGHAPFWMRGKK